MILTDISLKRPIAMTVVLLALGLFGFLSFRNIGVDLLPQVDVPYVTVVVVYPGASPEEIETSVARKIEDAVSQVDGLKHVTATCANNFCQVMLEFHLDRDVDVVATDVREKIDLIRNDLPSGAEAPKVMKYDVNAQAVVTLALTGGGYSVDELYDYADDRIADRFSSLPGVASVELIGGEEREVVVEIDRDKLVGKGLTVAEVVGKVGRGNLKIPVGEIDEGRRSFNIMFDAEAKVPSGLGDIELGSVRGQRVYLRDVATFSFGTKKHESLGYLNGHPAIVMKITKKGEANATAVVDLVRKACDGLENALPQGMVLHWVRDDGDYVKATVRGGFDSIWQGILLTGVILILFLADWRTALAAFVSIPVTMVIALIGFALFDYSFNLVTMSAIGISTGILVANSIVVLENVAAYMQKNREVKGKKAIAESTAQIAVAVCASALTNIVVFLPLATMKTLIGRVFVPFAIVVTAATFASLFVSFTLTPILAALFGESGEKINRLLARLLTPWNVFYRWCEDAYLATLKPVLAHPWITMILILAVTVASFRLALPGLQVDFIPKMDKGELTVRLEYPADSSLEASAETTLRLAESIRELKDSEGEPLARDMAITVGKTQGILGQVSQGTYLAEITVVMKPMDQRRDSAILLAEKIRDVCREQTDVSWSVLMPSIIGGSGQSAKLRILGDDLDVLNQVGLECVREIKGDKASMDVEHSIRSGRPEIRIHPERAVINDLGVSPQNLGLTLRGAITGLKPATFTLNGRSYDIRVRLKQEEGSAQIPEMSIPSPDGKPFTLSSVAELTKELKPVQIVRLEKRRAVTIYSNNAPGYGLATALKNQVGIVEKKLPPGYEINIGGTAEFMEETFGEFRLVTIVAVILAYLLLCAIMESWTMPFIIMFTVPFAYLGMFIAIRLTGTTFSIFGLLAGITLVGVVVNAAILLIDDLRERNENGIHGVEAVMQTSRAKFRPILMSCGAALFGMLPMAISGGMGSELRTSMGIGSVGGMALSSLVSLYLIPVMCAVRKH